MAAFTESQLEYLRSQRLAHLATADSKGAPHVVPLRFRVAADGTAIEVGGRGFGRTKKYRDMKANPKVAIVVDDIASTDPWKPRGIEIRGLQSFSRQAPDRWAPMILGADRTRPYRDLGNLSKRHRTGRAGIAFVLFSQG